MAHYMIKSPKDYQKIGGWDFKMGKAALGLVALLGAVDLPAEPMMAVHKGDYLNCPHKILLDEFMREYEEAPQKFKDWMSLTGKYQRKIDLDQDGIKDTVSFTIAQNLRSCNFYQVLKDKETRVRIHLSHNNQTYHYTVLGGLTTKIKYPLGKERYVELVGHDMHNRPWNEKLFFGDTYDNADKPTQKRKSFKFSINGRRM